MMSDTAISVEELGKCYLVGHQEREQYVALRDVISRSTQIFLRKAVDLAHGRQIVQGDEIEEFWALRDVSFEVKQGEVVGIIGRNGAGKSTLLKILSRITEPTKGRVRIRGRLASLLEVGTGFHPELTGRENVYLNGAILGMSRTEIQRKFDEIVSFAEVERFLDTPVKHYSSGMYVRLAFAVAAHLEPDILVVDEVLAVGDVAFQQKCLGKMGSFSEVGTTVLMVSHNMGAVRDLCSRAIVLDAGRLLKDGRSSEVITTYLQTSSTSRAKWRRDSKYTSAAAVIAISITSPGDDEKAEFVIGDAIHVDMEIDFTNPIPHPQFGVQIHSDDGTAILDLRTRHNGPDIPLAVGRVGISMRVDALNLYPGKYYLSPWVTDASSNVLDWREYCLTFTVLPRLGPFGDMRLNLNLGKYHVTAQWDWRVISYDLAEAVQ